MSAVVSSSKIPVAAHRRQSTTSSHSNSPTRTAPAANSVAVSNVVAAPIPTPSTASPASTGLVRRKESPSKIPTPSSTAAVIQNTSSGPRERPQSIDIEDEFKNSSQYTRLIATLQQHQEQASPKASPTEAVSSPSRIPIAARKLSTASGSSDRSPHRSSEESSPAKVRRNGTSSEVADSSSAIPILVQGNNSCDDISSSPVGSNSPHRTKIPTLKGPRSTSPPKKPPTFGWSLSPERHSSASPKGRLSRSPDRPLVGHNLSSQNSSSTSSVSSSSNATTTSRTPKSNGSDNSATEQLIEDHDLIEQKPPWLKKRDKKKQYEAFMMTGDRMICLAKTPAAGSHVIGNRPVDLQQVPFTLGDGDPSGESVSVPSSPAKQEAALEVAVALREAENSSSNRKKPKDNLFRNSTSEDQLLLHSSNVISPNAIELLDQVSGSADTFLGSTPDEDKAMPPLTTKGQQDLPKRQTTAHSPDFSTSSLISSEHYNGESLLDQDNLSPQTSSSPDTPEWSLMDSFHKQQQQQFNEAKAPLLPIASGDERSGGEEASDDPDGGSVSSEAIKSDGNKVIITIGATTLGNVASLEDWSDRLSDTTSITASTTASTPTAATIRENLNPGTAPVAANYPSLNSSSAESSEESDLESLKSYHPPARPIDIPSAERLAKRLFYLEGFKRTDVSRHLGKNNEFSQVVAEEYLRYFDFSGGLSLDAALRRFLQHFCLTGETQERERVLLHFSRRYLECNPDYVQSPALQLFRSLDAVHTLTCAIMLLNTDLHGDSVGLQRKMTCNEFIENLRELNDGQNFPRDLLRSIYYSIKETPVPWAAALDEMVAVNAGPPGAEGTSADPVKQVISTFSDAGGALHRTPNSGQEEGLRVPTTANEAPSVASTLAIGKAGGGINPFINLPDPSTAQDYKKGYVMRKCCVDSNGKKTKLGKRSWRMFFVTLRDMVLYCFKDEKSIRQAGAFEDFSAAIRIHHGLAVRASDYTKKQFVFRLHTADRAEYLFQTSDEKELLTWIDAINYVVASFSAPQLPAPCSSAGRFQRPLMPSSKSALGMNDQLASHESQLQQLRAEYDEALRSAPLKNAKATVWQSYREREEFMQFEIMRYDTYILTLRTKNAHDT